MLSKNNILPLYRSGVNSFDHDFYEPNYRESTELFRASGYFSLSSLILSIDGLIYFAQKGGKVYIICNPELSLSDIELIKASIGIGEKHITRSLIETITEYQITDGDAEKLDVVCNMIADGIISIKIAYQPLGIYHEKLGIFKDEEGNMVYYNGSLNETRNAHLHNTESILVFCSWNLGFIETINNELSRFKKLWSGHEDNSVTVIDFPEAAKNELFNCYKSSENLNDAIDKYIKNRSNSGKKELFSYQKKAIEEFCLNGYSHFYEMATGTGKTFTSIKTIERLKEVHPEKKLVMICVPQTDLQNQWKDSLIEEGFTQVYLFGGDGVDFDLTLSEMKIDFYSGDDDVICIAVYDTFFQKLYPKIQKFFPVFLIVDEAHNLTASNLSTLKRLNPSFKLGLSATIQRFSETESKDIVDFFTPSKTFYYGIEDAIENGFLSEYEYYPIFVHLTEEENDKYKNKTKLLAQELNKEEPDTKKIDEIRRERSLILKQASNKLPKLRELLDAGYNFVNSVVYCGQGKKEEGESWIDAVTKTLYEYHLDVAQFTSHTADRKRTLSEFEIGYFNTLVAIKCFDEGVDVPKLDKIYIMASDSALRQTVQRRGRVLRKCKESGKTIAYIYDMVVLPALEAGTFGSDSLLKIELSRANEYNRLALNKSANDAMFASIKNQYHITLNDDIDYESEPD